MSQQINRTQSAGRGALTDSPAAPEGWSPSEQVAALADGALERHEAQRILDRLFQSAEMRSSWNEIHLIGDFLRSDEMVHGDDGADFMRRFAARLESEPAIVAPLALTRGLQRKWMRYGLPGISVAAAVALVTWMILPQINPVEPVTVAAKQEPARAVALTEVPQQPAAVDVAKLNEYLAAHRQLSDSMVRGPGYVQAASMSFARSDQE